MKNLLHIQSLKAWYGPAQILFKINLRVNSGECVALLGRNGAGKSTLVKSIMGLVQRQAHSFQFLNQDASNWATDQLVRAGIAYVPEDRRIFTNLTVLENLKVGRPQHHVLGDGRAAPQWELKDVLELFPRLQNMLNRSASQMSGGEQQMLSIARSLMVNPLLLLLDEPTEGIAPVLVEQMSQAILQLKSQGVSVLLSEQNWAFASSVCDRAYVLQKGQVVFNGNMSDIQHNNLAQDALWVL
ncbi:MAG: ABC transporter ATP-binding protein [Betaproteobacteria bacterium]|nr:ABC transporter ATP-binding protein [Betaproteobacteria bacterium]NBY06966.1 ABC transporter ATP-binding protein [Betaproteobacteria bacterium]